MVLLLQGVLFDASTVTTVTAHHLGFFHDTEALCDIKVLDTDRLALAE
jgi:hypothetical protein